MIGGFLIWLVWIEAEPVGLWLIDALTAGLGEGHGLREHLLEAAAHMRPLVMGLTLLVVMRFAPRGLVPEHRGR